MDKSSRSLSAGQLLKICLSSALHSVQHGLLDSLHTRQHTCRLSLNMISLMLHIFYHILCCFVSNHDLNGVETYSVVQSARAISFYFTSKQMLSFGIADQYCSRKLYSGVITLNICMLVFFTLLLNME